MILLSKLLNAKEFKDSFKTAYRKFEQANESVTDYYRDETYQFMRNRIQKGYVSNAYSSYFRTYALRDTLDASTGKTPLGDTFTLNWDERRTKFESKSIWGEMTVQGTHRTFFGSSKYGLSVGDEVPVPIILNEMKNHNISRKRKNPFYGFIDETEIFVETKLLSKHEKHFLDFFDL